MKKFIFKLFFFLFPFLIYFSLVAIFDPFDAFGFVKTAGPAFKENIIFKIDRPLAKTIAFRQNPSTNVLVGNCRMQKLFSLKTVKEVTGKDYFMMAFGGASLQDLIDMFWYSVETGEVNEVVFGVNYDLFAKERLPSRFQAAEQIAANPFRYLVSKPVFRALRDMVVVSLSSLLNKEKEKVPTEQSPEPVIPNKTNKIFAKKMKALEKEIEEREKPKMTEEEFWTKLIRDYQKGLVEFREAKANKEDASDYFLNELRKIADYSKKNQIQLTFVVFPSFRDYQQMIEKEGLSRDAEQFKMNLAKLAPTIDFDYPNELTREPENFSIPIHLQEHFAVPLIQEVLLGKGQLGRILAAKS